jgi:hypothetical protein
MLINDNKFVYLKQKVSWEVKIKKYIKIYNFISHIAFQIFLFNYRTIVFFNINHFK